MSDVLVPARFNGPPESANGGWFSGTLAGLLDASGPVSVRLASPPPMETPMRLESHGGGLSAVAGEIVVATATGASDFTDPVPERVPYADAEAVGSAFAGLTAHAFPTCYVCGTARTDGLGLRPALVPGTERYAAAWVPREVTPAIVWGALDCPGGWASGFPGRPMVLGTMTAAVTALPAVGEQCVVVAEARGGSGRTFRSASVLYAEDGSVLGRAEAVWVAIDPTTIRPLATDQPEPGQGGSW